MPFRRIYVLDTSRIARDTLQAQSLKFYLRKKRGIELVFLHLPQTGSLAYPHWPTLPSKERDKSLGGGIPRYGSARDRGSYGLLAIAFLGAGAADGGW